MLYLFSSKPNTIITYFNKKDIEFELINKENYDEFLQSYSPRNGDFGLVYDFGKIIPEHLLQNLLLLNIHFSLLPKYRGAVPVEAAILAGEANTGITIQKMAKGMDTGDILLQESTEIKEAWSAGELQSYMDSQLPPLLEKLFARPRKDWEFVPQEGEPSYCYIKWLNRENALVDFTLTTAVEVVRKVRAYNPEPYAWSKVLRKGKVIEMNIMSAEENFLVSLEPGQVLFVKKSGLLVGCKTGVVLLTNIVLAGSKPLKNGDIVALKGSIELA